MPAAAKMRTPMYIAPDMQYNVGMAIGMCGIRHAAFMTNMSLDLHVHISHVSPKKLYREGVWEEVPKRFLQGLCNLWEVLLEIPKWQSRLAKDEILRISVRPLRRWIPHSDRMGKIWARIKPLLGDKSDESEKDFEEESSNERTITMGYF